MKDSFIATGRRSIPQPLTLIPTLLCHHSAFWCSLSSPSLSTLLLEPELTIYKFPPLFHETFMQHKPKFTAFLAANSPFLPPPKKTLCLPRRMSGWLLQFPKAHPGHYCSALPLGDSSSSSETHAIMFQHLPPSFNHVFYQVTGPHTLRIWSPGCILFFFFQKFIFI